MSASISRTWVGRGATACLSEPAAEIHRLTRCDACSDPSELASSRENLLLRARA